MSAPGRITRRIDRADVIGNSMVQGARISVAGVDSEQFEFGLRVLVDGLVERLRDQLRT